MKLTPGKLAGMKAVSNERGIIAAAAMDQRGSLQKSLKASAPEGKAIGDHEMEEFKSLVAQVLTQHASAILLDPEWGLPAARARAKGSGLLLAYEKTGYDATEAGRLPDLLDVWSVQRLKEAGADCIKILLYYNPKDPAKINDFKHAWTERIGDECKANDIPYFLEFVTYQDGVDEKSLEFAKLKPELVAGAMQEFSKDRYGVDVLKVEVPVNMQFVQGAKSAKGTEYAYTREQAGELFRKAAAVATKPFIYLSAGVSNDEFTETLALATDYDVWHETHEAVSVEAVIANLGKNVATAKAVLRRVIPMIGGSRVCECPSLLKAAVITSPAAFPHATRRRLDLLIGKYFPIERGRPASRTGHPRHTPASRPPLQ